VHRIVHEVDNCLTEPYEAIIEQLFRRKPEPPDEAQLAKACDAFVSELAQFEQMLGGRPFFALVPSAADFALYPMAAFVQRFERVKPDLGLSARVPPGIQAWAKRMKALPYHDKCWPPHWKG
jgi:glutathione S-transferase